MIHRSMAFTVAVHDFFKIFLASKAETRERIATWLDGVAEEGRRLTDGWLPARSFADYEEAPAAVFRNMTQNLSSCQTFQQAYDNATTVLGGRVAPELLDCFKDIVARMIIQRDRVKEQFKKLYGRNRVVVPDQTREEELRILADLVGELNALSAALEGLANNFRAVGTVQTPGILKSRPF
jgi:hypothetical protein